MQVRVPARKIRKKFDSEKYKEQFLKYPRHHMKKVKKVKGQKNLKGEDVKYVEVR